MRGVLPGGEPPEAVLSRGRCLPGARFGRNRWLGRKGAREERPMSDSFEFAREPSPEGAQHEPQSGCSLMVKLQPSKLVTRVRFPSPAPEMPVPPKGRHGVTTSRKDAAVAQSVEHFLGKEEVTGSIPVSSSSLKRKRAALGPAFFGTPKRGADAPGPVKGRDPAENGLMRKPMGKRKEFSVHGEG